MSDCATIQVRINTGNERTHVRVGSKPFLLNNAEGGYLTRSSRTSGRYRSKWVAMYLSTRSYRPDFRQHSTFTDFH